MCPDSAAYPATPCADKCLSKGALRSHTTQASIFSFAVRSRQAPAEHPPQQQQQQEQGRRASAAALAADAAAAAGEILGAAAAGGLVEAIDLTTSDCEAEEVEAAVQRPGAGQQQQRRRQQQQRQRQQQQQPLRPQQASPSVSWPSQPSLSSSQEVQQPGPRPQQATPPRAAQPAAAAVPRSTPQQRRSGGEQQRLGGGLADAAGSLRCFHVNVVGRQYQQKYDVRVRSDQVRAGRSKGFGGGGSNAQRGSAGRRGPQTCCQPGLATSSVGARPPPCTHHATCTHHVHPPLASPPAAPGRGAGAGQPAGRQRGAGAGCQQVGAPHLTAVSVLTLRGCEPPHGWLRFAACRLLPRKASRASRRLPPAACAQARAGPPAARGHAAPGAPHALRPGGRVRVRGTVRCPLRDAAGPEPQQPYSIPG